MADETTQSPKSAPEYALHRVVRETTDTLPETNRARGMNMQGYHLALVQVVPVDGANPDVRVQWWSEKAASFVDGHAPITRTGNGVDTSYEFEVESHGRALFVAVDGGVAAGQTVRVYVAGADMERV